MNASEVRRSVEAAIADYRPPLTDAELVGTPWDRSRIDEELALLRAALVLPSTRVLHVHERPEERVWLVAVEHEVAVYFDEVKGEFGLGSLRPDGAITDWGLYGDLVGTFMAR